MSAQFEASDSSEQLIGQVRGGSLLLVSRAFAVGVNLVTQVIVVRWLSPGDFGALAYVLSLTWVARNVSTLGMHRVLPRLIPRYHERHEYDRLFGAIGLQAGTIISTGIGLWLALLAGKALGLSLSEEEPVGTLLLILALSVPLEALDYFLFEILLSAFHRPRSIALRKHVIGPTVKLGVVLLMVWLGASVRFLAIGLVVSAAIGIAIYIPLIVRMFRELGLLAHLSEGIRPPWGALAVGLPLLTTDLMLIARHSLDAIVVDAEFGSAAVAQLRAVQPAATLNELVAVNFALLFMPLASRLTARGADDELDELYWTTAAWQTFLSLPVFLLTFSLSLMTTTILFGEAYRASAPILMVLAIGLFVSAALGPSDLILVASGRIRYLVVGNLSVTVLNVALLLFLVPRFGALGAAIATVVAQLAQRTYEQVGLRDTPVRRFRAANGRLYITVAAAASGLWAISHWLDPGPLISLALVGTLVMMTIRFHRRVLSVEKTFPEATRFPGVAFIFGLTRDRGASGQKSSASEDSN
ncbi:MAG: oligosaccharide flippase family protein [Candidatus Limnocylindria bacterium]